VAVEEVEVEEGGKPVVGEMLGGETGECWEKVRGKLVLVLRSFPQFCQSSRSGNMRRLRRSRQRRGKGRV